MSGFCSECRWWKMDRHIPVGQCRRYAPPAVASEKHGLTVYAAWPVTAEHDRCGQHEPLPALPPPPPK